VLERFHRLSLVAVCQTWLRNHRFSRFVIVGAVNTAVTYLIYLGFVLFLPYLVAYTVTTIFGVFLSYILNARFVFRRPLRLVAALQYPAVYIVQYFLGVVLLYLLVEQAHLSKFVAPIAIVAATVPATYVLSRFVIDPAKSAGPSRQRAEE
jgi:putative flippase GtrA